MSWQSSTINPSVTTPAADISKITNDLGVLKGVIGGTPDAAVPSVWATTGAVTGQTQNSGTTGGTSTAYTLTPAAAIAAYTAGMTFWVTFNAASGASPTLQISGLASPPNLVKQLSDGSYANVGAGDIPANHRSRVTLLSATQALIEDMPPSAANSQLQQIGASVAANALTISASALSLDFRSTTLGSGSTTRVAGTPSNLVVPSGATLGAVNAVQSDIAVLALNNAGTIELAVVNIAGGVDLSETGLVSTTAISAAATSAGVVYSTTARTSVAYRVIGVVRSTQATAGTWATAPSLIQGVGGQAFAALQSLGYGQTWQTVTRTSGTTYYNITNRPIMINGYVGGGTSATITVGGVVAAQTSTTAGTGAFLTAIVPVGASYVNTNMTNVTELR
jgi:hypothetical protein